jgi:hypothetical protein
MQNTPLPVKPALKEPKLVRLKRVLSEMEKAARRMHLPTIIHEVQITPVEGARYGRCHENVAKFCKMHPGIQHKLCWNVLEETNRYIMTHGYPFWAQFHSVAQAPDGTYVDVTPTGPGEESPPGHPDKTTRHVIIEDIISPVNYMKAVFILQQLMNKYLTVNHRYVDFDTRYITQTSPHEIGANGEKMQLVGLHMIRDVCGDWKIPNKHRHASILKKAREEFNR